MQRERRLRKTTEVRHALRDGRSWATPLLILRGLPNDLQRNRFGFVVGKRVGGAVVRNRVKRWLREAARQAPVRQGWDIVLIARTGAAGAGYHELAVALGSLLQRARLLEDTGRPDADTRTEMP